MIKEKLAPPEYGADGRDKSTLSPIERYYDRLSSTRQGTNAASTLRKPPFNGSPEDADLISEFGDISFSAQDRSLPGLDRISTHPNSFGDLFGRGRGPKGEISRQTLEDERAQARHLENFRKLLDIPTLPDPTGFGLPVNPDATGSPWEGNSAATRPNPYSTLSSSPAPSPAPGILGVPSFAPSQLTPGQQGSAPEPPPSLSATRTPPPKLQFSAPMRKF